MTSWIALAALVGIALGAASIDIAVYWRATRGLRRRAVVLRWRPRADARARRVP
jgi:hypothetical protein